MYVLNSACKVWKLSCYFQLLLAPRLQCHFSNTIKTRDLSFAHVPLCLVYTTDYVLFSWLFVYILLLSFKLSARWGCSSVSSVRLAGCKCRFNCLVRQVFYLHESTFSADSLKVSLHPHLQSRASLTSVRTLRMLWSMSEFGGLWKH